MAIVETALERAKQQRAQDPSHPPVTAFAPAHAASRRGEPELFVAPVALDFPGLQPDQMALSSHRILLAKEHASGVADAYRILRTRLLHQLQAHGWNSLAVTSAGPGEGKSLTSLNLALSVASERRRNVFLIDLDLRKPSLCRYLGVYPPTALGEYLSGDARVEDVFFSITNNLIVAGGLRQYQNSADLLGNERFVEMLAYIRKLDPNALIIADLPPLLSVADALVVAPKLSATVLVVAEGGTKREALTRAREILAGVTLAGIVLNRAKTAVHNYYG